MLPVSVPRMAAARSWARADRAVCRQIPSQVRAWLWSQPYLLFGAVEVANLVDDVAVYSTLQRVIPPRRMGRAPRAR